MEVCSPEQLRSDVLGLLGYFATFLLSATDIIWQGSTLAPGN